MAEKKFYILTAVVSKNSKPGVFTHSAVTGWRICRNLEEAIGSFWQAVVQEKPGFSVDELIHLEIDAEDLINALRPNAQEDDGIPN